MFRIAVLALVVLVSCGTPQERCVRSVTKDIRTLDRLIATSRENLERGYAIVEERYTTSRKRTCTSSNGTRYTCYFPRTEIRRFPVSIDLNKEQAILDSQVAKRAQMEKQVAPQIKACQASFPEG